MRISLLVAVLAFSAAMAPAGAMAQTSSMTVAQAAFGESEPGSDGRA